MEEKYIIEKNTSFNIKGIAILLMLVHHMFCFPQWIECGKYTANESFANAFISATVFCVAIFAFVTGWSFVFTSKKSIKETTKSIFAFLLKYWIALAIIGAFAGIICGWKPEFKDVILEVVAYSSKLMKFCWYVPFYVFSILLMKLIYKIMDKNFIVALIVGVILPCVVLRLLIKLSIPYISDLLPDYYHYFPCVSFGYICHKYNLFGLLENLLKKCRISILFASLLFIVIAFVGKNYYPKLDFIYVALFTYSVSAIVQKYKFKPLNIINNTFQFFGKHSTNVWFLHCIISSAITRKVVQPIVYWCPSGLVCYITAVVGLFIISFVLDYFEGKLFMLIGLNNNSKQKVLQKANKVN